MDIEMVFVTVSISELNSLQHSIDEEYEDVLLDFGMTDRQGDGYLVLLQDTRTRRILDDLIEAGVLLDYTVFSLEV